MPTTEDTPPQPETSAPAGVRAILKTKEILGRARRINHGDLYSVLGANAVLAVLLIAINTAALFVVMGYLVARLEWTYHRDYQNALLTLLTLPVVAQATVGILKFYTQLARGARPGVGLFFRYHPGFFHMLLFWLAYYVMYFFLVKVALRGVQEPFRYEFEILFRMATGVLFFAWVFVRLIFAPLFIVDGNCNLRQAARRSWMLTSGRSRRTAWLVLIHLLLGASGFLFIGVGILYTFGLMLTAYVLIFDSLSHPETTGA